MPSSMVGRVHRPFHTRGLILSIIIVSILGLDLQACSVETCVMCGSEFHAYELEYHERLLHLLFDVNLRADAPERTLSNRNLLGPNQAAADEKFNEEFAPVRTELSITRACDN